MYGREYSLKTRYNFNKVYKFGETFITKNFLIKYLKVKPEVFQTTPFKKFAVVTSNKLSKKKVTQNRIRRIVATVIQENLGKFKDYYYYVFIPKKSILDKDGKILADVKGISSEINTFLSKMAVS